jgi:hypothetical protein
MVSTIPRVVGSRVSGWVGVCIGFEGGFERTVTYLAVENRMKGDESEKACAEAHKPAMAAVTERRIVFVIISSPPCDEVQRYSISRCGYEKRSLCL